MLYTLQNKRHLSIEHFRTKIMLNAYYIIKNYPLKASDLLMDRYIQQQYKMSLKNLCIKLLLNLTFFENDSGDLVLLFKDPKCDAIASLITYGNGAIPGSKILKTALTN
jgi:hypothetical protein